MALQTGTYTIASAHNDAVLDLEGGKDSIAKLITNTYHGGKSQQFKVTQLTPDEYSVQNVFGSSYVTAPEDGSDQQLYTSVYEPAHNRNTRWKITPAPGGGYTALHPHKALHSGQDYVVTPQPADVFRVADNNNNQGTQIGSDTHGNTTNFMVINPGPWSTFNFNRV